MGNNVSSLALAAGNPRPELVFQVSLLNLMKQGMSSPLLLESFETALSADHPLSVVRKGASPAPSPAVIPAIPPPGQARTFGTR